LLITHSGAVCRLAGTDGAEVAVASIGEPAGAAAVVMGGRLAVASRGGVLHIIPLPAKP
jgi:hypothetical protein